MNRDKSDNITPPLAALSLFRGIYKRVAVQLDIDPSYVSRVARGERNAPVVSEALRKEIQRVLGKIGLHNGDGKAALRDGNGKNHNHSNGGSAALLDGNHASARSDGDARGSRLVAFDGNHTRSGEPSKSGKKKPASASRKRRR
jgi:hypothetical protein